MSILDGLIFSTNSLFSGINKLDPQPFQILDEEDNVILEMTSLHELFYEQNNRVAYEPQEGGNFNSNSKQGTPFQLEITGTVIPMLKKASDTLENQSTLIEDTKIALDDLVNSDQIVQVVTGDYFYDNMTLKGVNYNQSPNVPCLFAVMIFQEVRVANVEFQPLPANQVSSPEDASRSSAGQIQPKAPTSKATTDASQVYGPGGKL